MSAPRTVAPSVELPGLRRDLLARGEGGRQVGEPEAPEPGEGLQRIAALYVQSGGVYFGLAGVDPWDVERDARTYAGPHPVVAHPPCQRWGRYWHGGPSVRVRKVKGDDGGCFAAALASVRAWGGVLEHPEASAAWRAFDLNEPFRDDAAVPRSARHDRALGARPRSVMASMLCSIPRCECRNYFRGRPCAGIAPG